MSAGNSFVCLVIAVAACASHLGAQQGGPAAFTPCPDVVHRPAPDAWRLVRADRFTFCVPRDWQPSGVRTSGMDAHVWTGGMGSITWGTGDAPSRRVASITITGMADLIAPPPVCSTTDRLQESIAGGEVIIYFFVCEGRHYSGARWMERPAWFQGQATSPATINTQLDVYRSVRFAAEEVGRCAVPAPDSSRYVVSDSVRAGASQVRAAVLDALRGRGYQVIGDTTAATIVTAPRGGWPDDTPNLVHWANHAHPGVALAINIEPVDEVTVMTITARAQCGLPQEPAHNHAHVENAATLVAAMDVGTNIIALIRRNPAANASAAAQAGYESRPALLRCPPLTYPDSLRRAGIGGRLVFSMLIDTAGLVDPSTIRLVSPPQDPDLMRAAREMLVSCVFRPAMFHRVPVPVRVEMPINFQP